MKVWSWLGVVLLVWFWGTLQSWECRAQDTSCLDQLAPCFKYLSNNDNGTKSDPPSSCCDPLKSVLESNAQCLCSMVSSRASSTASQAGINVTEAQELPGRCGQSVNPIACLVGSPPGARANNNNNNNNGRGGEVANGGNSGSRLVKGRSVEMLMLLVTTAFSATLQIIWASNGT